WFRQEPDSDSVTIESGDTWWDIACRYKQEGESIKAAYKRIQSYNADIALHPGDKITVREGKLKVTDLVKKGAAFYKDFFAWAVKQPRNLVSWLWGRRRFKRLNQLIARYRVFDHYTLPHEVYPAESIHIPSRLPSEPPEGITYQFCASGYTGDPASDYCVIPTIWRNIHNYCHWHFSELPLLFLAFESKAANIVLPDEIIKAGLPFQKKWLSLLYSLYPKKKIIKCSQAKYPPNALIPRNHDTSSSRKPLGLSQYRHYHHSRATPYLINKIENKYKKYLCKNNQDYAGEIIYINRRSRRLENETDFRKLLTASGVKIVRLEKIPLAEQAAMFLNAGLIIGFHGAGLTNLLYAGKSTKVIEMVDRDCVHPCYADGLLIPGKKATRTYFHMLAAMKNIPYFVSESKNYVLDLDQFQKLMQQVRQL
ncbi:MAG TPA: glycosyltransferase 61 family protein, partial [Spirochaetota bacterium]|nr:glycosyltransferase 61 family protein [Spirochaetota bacterium]